MNARLPLEAPVRESELAGFAAIARIAAAKGWGRYAERLGLGRHDHPGAGEEVKSDAVRLREALEELGPTFVKLGQMMAGRTDIFPRGARRRARQAARGCGVFPAAGGAQDRRRRNRKAHRRAVRELRRCADGGGFDGQVHCATLHDGTAVIVKVQRPSIAATVEADISVLRRLARLAGTVVPSLRAFDLPDLVAELAETLRGELDFEREGRNAEPPSSTARLSPSTLHREATMAEHSHENHPSGGGGYGRWVFWGFLLIAGYFLITEHWAHTIQYLPFVLLLACPLLHLFHGHGGHGGHGKDDKEGGGR